MQLSLEHADGKQDLCKFNICKQIEQFTYFSYIPKPCLSSTLYCNHCFCHISPSFSFFLCLFITYLSSITHPAALFHFSQCCTCLCFWLIHLHTHFHLSSLLLTTDSTLFTHNVLLSFLSSAPSLHQRSQTTTLTMKRRHWRALCLTWSYTIAMESTLKGRRLVTRCEPLVLRVDTLACLLLSIWNCKTLQHINEFYSFCFHYFWTQ